MSTSRPSPQMETDRHVAVKRAQKREAELKQKTQGNVRNSSHKSAQSRRN